MPGIWFVERLRSEFTQRKARNPRYSLRAFSKFLEVDHSTLSQVLRGVRSVPEQLIALWSDKLGIDAEEQAAYAAAELAPDAAQFARQHALRQWTGEAVAVATEPAHREILRLTHSAVFRPDSRWLAVQIGVTADDVNLALSRLLRLRLLVIDRTGRWHDPARAGELNEIECRRLALARVRTMR
jgi:hypothetical protein